MSEIKVGDWIEVTNIDRQDAMFGIFIGGVFQVSEVLSDDGVEVELHNGMTWWFRVDQFRKRGSTAARYRKRPMVIEAIQFTGKNFGEIYEFTDGSVEKYYDDFCVIPTLEGNHIASVDDYIIRGIKGEYYPCKLDIFVETYEKI